jgi:hypothetical protein
LRQVDQSAFNNKDCIVNEILNPSFLDNANITKHSSHDLTVKVASEKFDLRTPSLTRWLQKTNTFWFALYAAGSAFCLYTCVYAFRKAFSVATFDGLMYLG